MFDPTIFDNLKVVIEGAVYDQDLDGNLQVIARKDMIDLAVMAREFSITFQRTEQIHSSCRWRLFSTVDQLANEIHDKGKHTEQGCTTIVEFIVQATNEESVLHTITGIIDNIWGDRNKVYTLMSKYPIKKEVQLKTEINFKRVILEDDIDDLLLMLSYMEKTLKILQQNGY